MDIIILSLNRLSETIQAVQSALEQRGITAHVAVLDQGSRPEVVLSLAQTFRQTAHFSLYSIPENLGVAGGRNLLTSLGHGKLIIGLDNDAAFANKWVAARAHQIFMQTPDIGALGFNILARDGVQPDTSSWGYPVAFIKNFQETFDTTTFVGAGHAIRRVTWNAAGGYDPTFFFSWEEYDFCLRAVSLGWRIRYDGSLSIIHKAANEERVAWSAERATYFIRNRLLISRKWGASWLGLAPRIVAYLINGLVNKRFLTTIAGIKAAYRARTQSPQKMPRAMRNYIFANETLQRGSWADRLRFEVFGRTHRDPIK